MGANVRIAASNNGGLGAFGVREVEQSNSFRDGFGWRASRREVVGETGLVGSSYSLDPDAVSAIVLFERVSEGDTEGALVVVSDCIIHALA